MKYRFKDIEATSCCFSVGNFNEFRLTVQSKNVTSLSYHCIIIVIS